jgi:hypothetical protein
MTRPEKVAIVFTALYLFAVATVDFYVLSKVFPGGPDPAIPAAQSGTVRLFFQTFTVSLELRQMWLAACAGILGNLIASLLSFASYVGNRKLITSWLTWYLLNPLVGGGIAVLFYFVYRAGLVTTGGPISGTVSAYGIAALAGLSGMFSKAAADKLKEVFDVAFRARENEKRADKLNPKPAINKMSPARAPKGTQVVDVEVRGEGFAENSVVHVDGIDRPATFVDTRLLRFKLTGNDLATARNVGVRVQNPDGSTSSPAEFTVS